MQIKLQDQEITQELIENGFSKIDLSPSLEEYVTSFFFDLCEYLLVIINDSELSSSKLPLDEFKQFLKEKNFTKTEAIVQEILLKVNKLDRSIISRLYEIGTRPMRLYSGKKIYFNSQIQNIVNNFFKHKNDKPIIANPFNGETLHIFPPGEENFKYNLPIHQDFQYLMQSSSQLTFWLNITDNTNKNAGGIRLYPKTNKLGIAETKKDINGHYEVIDEKYPQVNLNNFTSSKNTAFELYAVDSLTWHKSLHNISKDSVRITYIFRFSDIGSKQRIKYGLDLANENCQVFENEFSHLYKN